MSPSQLELPCPKFSRLRPITSAKITTQLVVPKNLTRRRFLRPFSPNRLPNQITRHLTSFLRQVYRNTNPLPPKPTMASRIGPRSVKDATRFTSTIPHATSKTAGAAGGRAAAATPKPSPRVPGETPEQRVRRLRQAHIAAQKAQISRTDRVIDASRRFLDVAHRWTVGGIVVFTGMITPQLPCGAIPSHPANPCD